MQYALALRRVAAIFPVLKVDLVARFFCGEAHLVALVEKIHILITPL